MNIQIDIGKIRIEFGWFEDERFCILKMLLLNNYKKGFVLAFLKILKFVVAVYYLKN